MAEETTNNVVVMHGEEFHLEEPSTDVTIRILNVLGTVATRSEAHVQRMMKNPSNRAVMLGLLAVISKNDLVKLGSAVLQFEDDSEGRKWLKKKGVKVAPIIKALMINIGLSDDLMEALRSFFDGIGLVGKALEKLNLGDETETETETETEEETEEESGQD
jgi:hypothetical protein